MKFLTTWQEIEIVSGRDFWKYNKNFFALDYLDNLSIIEIYNLINKNPTFVRLRNRDFGFIEQIESKIKTLENFNVLVDLGGLDIKYLLKVLKTTSKPVVVTNAILSTFCDKLALTKTQEELLVKKNALIMVNVDNFNINNLSQAISRFINTYGSNNLAVYTTTKRKKIKRLIQNLLLQGISCEDIEKITTINLTRLFEFRRDMDFCSQNCLNFY